MRNRAKCKLCKSIIESFHEFDYTTCMCREISITGGNVKFECSANNFANFMRVDDLNNEIVVRVKDEDETLKKNPNKQELLKMLDDMVEVYERLPEHAMGQSITNFEMSAALLLIASIFKSKD